MKVYLRPDFQLEKLIVHKDIFLLDLLITERKTIRCYTVDVLVIIEMKLK